MKLSDLKNSGHAPSLFSAFLHFDVSFMVWVILGALMPFIATDPALTGANLKITPSAMITKASPYTLIVKGPDATKHEPKTTSHLLIKPGDPTVATKNSVKPAEKYLLDSTSPATITASLDKINAKSKLIQVAQAQTAHGVPNENVLALKPMVALQKAGKAFQPLANGYPASVKLFLVGLPLLAAGFWRILLGFLADRFGSKRVGMTSMFLTLLPLVVGWQYATEYNSLLFVGFFLGLAGASFAVSLPLASRWYPPHLQGVAMGIAGAGNSGTVLATLFAPLLAKAFGWHFVFGLLMVPVALTFVVFSLLAKDAPSHVKPAGAGAYIGALAKPDTLWFCLLYFVTFGGFVGLSSFINTFFVDQFDFAKATVGAATAVFIIAGSLVRPIGGLLSDKIGGIRMLTVLYATVAAMAIGVGLLMTISQPATFVCLFVLMACLGMGNGSVFQMVPQRFKKEIGVMTGIVGAAGGVGGYYLNFVLGHLKDSTSTYASGFYAFAGIAVIAFVVLRAVAPGWQRTWLGEGGVAKSHSPQPERVLVTPGGGELEPA
jgi:NNP family nitrate/nitrite transporter-like MFS transporter